MKPGKIHNSFLDGVLLKFSLALTVLAAASGFTLFQDGGARAQGLQNSVEHTGLLKYADVAFIPLAFLLPCYFLLVRGRYAYLRAFPTSSGAKLSALVLLFSLLHFANGVEFSNYMLVAVLRFLATTFIVWLCVSQMTAEAIFGFLNKFYLACFLLSLYLILLVPSYGISVNSEQSWQGMFDHKNALGDFCASYAIVLLGRPGTSRTLTLTNLALAILLALGSKSYTAVSALVLSIALFLLPRPAKLLLLRAKWAVLFIALAASALIVALSVGGYKMSFLDKDFTFSDRNQIWLFSFVGYAEHPIIGQGMGALVSQNSQNTATMFNATGQTLASQHNGFIAILYNFGALGLAAFIFTFANSVKLLDKSSTNSYLILSCLLALIAINTFDDKLMSANIGYIALILLISMNEIKKS